MVDMISRLWIILSKRSGVAIPEIKGELEKLEAAAYSNPKLYREVRHDIQSGLFLLRDTNHPLYEYAGKYGVQSLVFGTYCKVVAVVEQKAWHVKEMTSKSIPPAFDSTLVAKSRGDYSMRQLVNMATNTIGICKVRLGEWRRGHREDEIVLLMNGSSMGYQVGSVDVTDIMANICTYPSYHEYPKLREYLHLINDRGEKDPFVYLEHEKVYADYAFHHDSIPDKDGKTREVYQGNSDVQVISKRLHEMFSYIAEGIPGNYTFSHKSWIRNIIKQGWNKSKDILTTDMSKYSDTLARAFIMLILEAIGIHEEVVKEIDHLYSREVLDRDTGKRYSGSLATYQGQYGDFPMITIANLVLQECVYKLLSQPQKPGYNAAVGDDTGFTFDNQDLDQALAVIKEVYATVGVNINDLKTGRLQHGIGYGDFVKLTFDGEGIRPFLEYRSYRNNNVDQVIRDIFDNTSLTNEEKSEYLRDIFGREISSYLMGLHKINGGLRVDRITISDVVQLIDNTYSLMSDIKEDAQSMSKLLTFLEHARKELNSMEHPSLDRPCGLRDTCLCKLRDKTLDDWDGEEDKIDDSIVVNCLAVARIGLDRDMNFIRLVGMKWSDVEREVEKREKGEGYDPWMVDAYDDVNAVFNMMGRLRDRLKHNKSRDFYLRHYMEHSSDDYYHIFVPQVDSNYYDRIADMAEYNQCRMDLVNDWNSAFTRLVESKWSGYTGKFSKIAKYFYYTDGGKKYRLYLAYNTKYDLITQDILDNNPLDFHGMTVDEVVAIYRFN